MSDFFQNGIVTTLPDLGGRPTRELERELASHAEREGRPVALLATDLHGPRSALESVGPWCRADATRLPFRGQAFDLVICSMALHHFKPREVVRLLREAVRVGRNFRVPEHAVDAYLRQSFYDAG